jgi:hypothetical protein
MGKLGAFLIVLSLVALGFWLSPIVISDNQSILNIMQPFLCAPGEDITMVVVVTHDFEGTGYSGDFDCHPADAASYDVTAKAFILGAASFTIPFLIGLFMCIAAFNRAVRGVISTRTVEINSGWNQPSMSTAVSNAFHSMNQPPNSMGFGASAPAAPAPAAGNAELTQRLKQLRDAYDAGMISHEEYERTRAELLKDFSSGG